MYEQKVSSIEVTDRQDNRNRGQTKVNDGQTMPREVSLQLVSGSRSAAPAES